MSDERMELGILPRPIAMPSIATSNGHLPVDGTGKVEMKWPASVAMTVDAPDLGGAVASLSNGGSDGAADLSPASSASGSGTSENPSSRGIKQDPESDNGANDGGNSLNMNDSMDTGNMNSSDAEGVWSQDIDQAFQEALAIYPPCGRRKIILSDEGKMYGRNELIARYIKLRTGKTRTRKQVSSHIQVLARKKQREIQAKIKNWKPSGSMLQDHVTKEKAMTSLSSMSSAQIVSMGAFNKQLAAGLVPGTHNFLGPPNPLQPGLWNAGSHLPGGLPDLSQGMGGYRHPLPPSAPIPPVSSYNFGGPALPLTPNPVPTPPAFEGRTIWTPKFRLCEFSSYCQPEESKSRHEIVRIDNNNITANDPLLEPISVSEMADKFPSGREGLKDLFEKGPPDSFFLVKFWADISFNAVDDNKAFYGVDSRYEGKENIPISVSTKVCSFGKQVVEKVETEFPFQDSNTQGSYVYRINRSPMCEYMVKFINQLKKLPEKYMMNSVLENFTILQVVTNKDTRETLLCIAFVFEISPENHGSTSYNVYRLVSD